MRILIAICLYISLFDSAYATDIEQQRQSFLQAKVALHAGNYAGFSQLSEQLRNYPLYPYLLYAELEQQIDQATIQEAHVLNFLTQYADTPLAGKLRNLWLSHLAKQQRWTDYLRYYQPSKEIYLQCQYLQALLAQGKYIQMQLVIERVWLNGRMQSPVCEKVFASWYKTGNLTLSSIYKRLELAVANNNQPLIEQLAAWLPISEQAHIQLWKQVHANPELISQPKLFTPFNYRTKLILFDGIGQLAKKDPAKILILWPELQSMYAFGSQDQKKITYIIALALARNNHLDAPDWLAKVDPIYINQTLREWRIRAALAQQNWQQVRYWIEQLPPTERKNSCWQYWYARALLQLGEGEAAARAIYLALINKIDYYGLLASQQLKQAYQPFIRSEEVSYEVVNQLATLPAMQRAYELYNLNLLSDARREWQWTLVKADREKFIAATQLAKQWHWYDRMMVAAAKANLQYDFSLQFPLAFHPQIIEAAQKATLDPAWLFAIMRQESNFMPDAKSSVGALGLMQLMPKTAQFLMNNLASESLLNTRLNIQLGSQYLRRLLEQFNGNVTIATAAYNLGPTRLKKYISLYQTLGQDIWIEILPWQETRNYVKHVLLNMAIYQQLLINSN